MKNLPSRALFLSLIAGACTSAPDTPMVDVAAETAALEAAAQAYHAAAIANDADAIAAFYTDASVAYPPNEAAIHGTEGFRAYAEGFVSVPNLMITFTDPQAVVGAGGDLGYTYAEGHMTFDGPDGETVEESLRDIHIWRKDATGAWKVLVDVWNSSDPLPGM